MILINFGVLIIMNMQKLSILLLVNYVTDQYIHILQN